MQIFGRGILGCIFIEIIAHACQENHSMGYWGVTFLYGYGGDGPGRGREGDGGQGRGGGQDQFRR